MRWLALLLLSAPAAAAPIVPQFTQGTMSSHTETTSKVTETIVSENYSTGFEYSASGVNIAPDGAINPVSNHNGQRMDLLRRTTKLVNRQTWRSLSVRRKPEGTRLVERHHHSTHHRNHKRYRYGFLLLGIIATAPVNAQDVGGISATASPTATSSGSVSNQAVQILQGSAITNTYGGNIQCQGPTLTVTPYLNRTKSWGLPYEYSYPDPVYDLSDLDDNGRWTIQVMCSSTKTRAQDRRTTTTGILACLFRQPFR